MMLSLTVWINVSMYPQSSNFQHKKDVRIFIKINPLFAAELK